MFRSIQQTLVGEEVVRAIRTAAKESRLGVCDLTEFYFYPHLVQEAVTGKITKGQANQNIPGNNNTSMVTAYDHPPGNCFVLVLSCPKELWLN